MQLQSRRKKRKSVPVHRHVSRSLSRYRPLVLARKVSLYVLHSHVSACQTHQHLHLRAHPELLVYLPGVSERYLGIRLRVRVYVAYVIRLVAYVLGKLEQTVRQRQSHSALGVYLEGVISAESLESCRQYGQPDVARYAVVSFAEAAQSVVCGYVWIHERGHLLAALRRIHGVVHDDILISEVAA